MATDTLLEPFGGIFLVPGVSKNKRLYTKEMIAKAVARMQARIADPNGLPISMRTSHGAGDRSEMIVARVTGAKQLPDGRAAYEARWYDTRPARDIAALVRPADGGAPGLRTVSIHGWFIEPRRVEYQGESVASADDLEVDNIDFTGNPGVSGALIDPPNQPTESMPTRPGCVAIFETWEDPMPETDTGQVEPVIDEAYTAAQKRDALKAGQAMKNADGEPSYTIKSKADLRKAIRAVGRGGADHDKIRAHIIDRAKSLGLSRMIPDTWNADGSLKESAGIRFGEIRECYDAMAPAGAGFAIDAYNGPVSLTLRAPSLDPSSLRAVAAAAMTAAINALGALDPDFDADIDVPGAPAEDTDGDAGQGGEDNQDPAAATPDDDEEDYTPGSGCPCGCGCAVPDEMAGGPGCPCACGCQVCGAVAGESAAPAAPTDAPTPRQVPAGTPTLVGEAGPEHVLPTAAENISRPSGTQMPEPTEPASLPAPEAETSTPTKESAVSETTPAAEAATPEAPATPAPVQIVMTQEQFAALLDRMAPKVAESAPAPVEQPAAAPVQEPEPAPATPAAESVTKSDVASAVAEALAASMPALRDSIVSQYGLPPRTGIRTSETDHGEKEMTPTELWDNRADLLLGNIGKVSA